MKDEKDIEKTQVNSYGHNNFNSRESVENSIYQVSNKKTEKLVTALYMVTDCMDSDDALRAKLRSLGVDILSNVYKISTVEYGHKNKHIAHVVICAQEIISFIEIAGTIGFVSEMNTSILKREFINLIRELEAYQSKDKHFTFKLDENMFNVSSFFETRSESAGLPLSNNNEKSFIKDSYVNPNKRTTDEMSFKKYGVQESYLTGKFIKNDKQDRSSKIINIIKDLPQKTGQKDISIKDISAIMTDCSEKTIQRELNLLISKGQIKKSGAKRWSRYYFA